MKIRIRPSMYDKNRPAGRYEYFLWDYLANHYIPVFFIDRLDLPIYAPDFLQYLLEGYTVDIDFTRTNYTLYKPNIDAFVEDIKHNERKD